MLLAARSDPTLAAYRDDILFRQTVDRYAHAWHHREPFWYFVVNVIPVLWLPLIAALPWLVGKWRAALQARDLRIALLLSWVALVVLFFSFSTGKRGVYVLPAVPAFVLACAPYLADLAQRRSVQRVMFGLAAAVSAICTLGAVYVLNEGGRLAELLAQYDLHVMGPMVAIAIGAAVVCTIARPRRGFVAYAGALTWVLLVVSFLVNPTMNDVRSGKEFIATLERTADPDDELGLVAFKEQYLLNIRRPIVHFGHARWRDADQEAADAALWLSMNPSRQLVVSDYARGYCFSQAQVKPVGTANRIDWFVVRGAADPACIARGKASAARSYTPPDARLRT